MLRRVALVRTDVSKGLSASINRVMEALSSSDTSVLTRATRRYIPEDAIPPVSDVCLGFLDRSRYLPIQVAPQLPSRG
jgi:hypothetical protein